MLAPTENPLASPVQGEVAALAVVGVVTYSIAQYTTGTDYIHLR